MLNPGQQDRLPLESERSSASPPGIRGTKVGKAIPHDTAVGHVTGSAPYIDDYVPQHDELLVTFVGSPVAAGTIQSVEIQAAADLPGVQLILLADDIPGQNHFGAIFSDEPLLAEKEVEYLGQPIAIIAADSEQAALAAQAAIKIDVASRTPIFEIEDALSSASSGDLIGPARQIARGDFAAAFAKSPHQISGTFHSGGQEQFYLESQAAIAYPDDLGCMVVHSSTQNPTETQAVVAEVLGLGQHEVICVCKRMGGGFGGKETQSAIPAAMVALVAHRTGRSARIVYTKDDDMRVTGKRHPYRTNYQAGFDDEGRLLAVKFDFYSNGGAYADLSTSVLERTMLHADNAYFLPDVEINAQVCRTNYPPNTAFRGFGGPQGMAVMENLMQEVSIRLQKDAAEIRRLNCYGVNDRNVTPYGQIFTGNRLPDIFSRLSATSNYQQRLAEIAEANRRSPTELRGIALTPMKFGISFTTKFLNQGNALVNVYEDGTIQVSTGATEMGQGVNTKIRQIVADEMGVALESVRVMATSTEKNNNTSPTAASAGTDLNGAAAVDACRKIKSRVAQFAAEVFADPSAGLVASADNVRFGDGFVFDQRRPDNRIAFGELAYRARRERVNLGARGFYTTPGVDFNRETGQGHPFFYFTTGCAVAEVRVDRWTGELKVERCDLLMDIGRPINPGIDRGQVIGGFIQGMGYVTAEKLVYDEQGELLSHSPTTYKIPGITDLPRTLNVDFIENHANGRNIRSSKAVGEPPLMLALCVWSAVKHALSFVAPGKVPELRIPATGEEILMAIERLKQD